MGVIFFFVHDFFYTVEPIEMKLKTYEEFNKIKLISFWYISIHKH